MKSLVLSALAAITFAMSAAAEENWQPFALIDVEGTVVPHPETGAKVLDGVIALWPVRVKAGNTPTTFVGYMPLSEADSSKAAQEKICRIFCSVG